MSGSDVQEVIAMWTMCVVGVMVCATACLGYLLPVVVKAAKELMAPYRPVRDLRDARVTNISDASER